VFEFELVSYGAGDSVVKRRFHTCVSKISFLKSSCVRVCSVLNRN